LPATDIAGLRTGQQAGDVAGAAVDRLSSDPRKRERLVTRESYFEVECAASGATRGWLRAAS
jgi:hypothetical protein